ncbi:MAG TPA: NAD-dependent epimerase/dehydratase family protein [Thermoflexia bacterium]|jgi:nucleoside-diphosphate-sugar epimerase|nr:NAD-dependent epimerase/dehydratase family protein [Thermoflexia bacterium]
MSRVLVTGATGFIGGYLAHRLVALGHDVRALVRRDVPDLEAAGIRPVRGDLRRPESLLPVLDGVEAVFHLAALRDTWGTPLDRYRQVNVVGTSNLIAAANVAGVRRFVHCSSVGVARYPGRLDVDESDPYRPASSQAAYHQTKKEAEQIVREAAWAGLMAVVVVRPVITYGPGDYGGMVARLLTLLARRRFLWIGDGQNHVDLVYIDDLVDGIVRAWEQGQAGRVYILSGVRPWRMQEVVEAACVALGVPPPPPLHIPVGVARMVAWVTERVWGGMLGRRPPVTRDAIATLTVDRGFSHTRARDELGYRPRWSLEAGLSKTVEWMREEGLI